VEELGDTRVTPVHTQGGKHMAQQITAGDGAWERCTAGVSWSQGFNYDVHYGISLRAGRMNERYVAHCA
jgi:hypothetical protein